MAVINEEQREELGKGLSRDQTDALVMMINFLHMKGPDIFVLRGYAGTGKTYLVGKLLDYIGELNKTGNKRSIAITNVALTAPTNKAVDVLRKRDSFSGKKVEIRYRTIHSLLGLKELIHDDGTISFVADKGSNSEIRSIDLLIVDEGSMLPDDIFHKIRPHSERVKIIIMGDPAQIPPVGQDDCIPFKECLSETFEEGYTLRRIMRQVSGNPIIEIASAVRDNLNEEAPVQLTKTLSTEDGKGMFLLNSFIDKEALKELMVSYFATVRFDANSDYCKVIAWRNKTVDYINNYLRCRMYGEGKVHEKITPGEKLIADKPVFDDLGENVIYNTSEEINVGVVEIKTVRLTSGIYEATLKHYWCKVSNRKGSHHMIKVIHPESKLKYEKYLKDLKQRAVDMREGKYWVAYYKATRVFANVSYNYAITAHKSQGSTYENVFVLEDDIDANPNIKERNRIKYTAYTRASDRLYIYKKLKPQVGNNDKQN